MLDLFRQLKLEYSKYVILIKCGNFYECFDEDALVMKNIFNYRIKELRNNLKLGFPLISLDKNIKKLKELNINYLIIEDKKIVEQISYLENSYNDYNGSVFDLISMNNRINSICNILKELEKGKKQEYVEIIEKLLCNG